MGFHVKRLTGTHGQKLFGYYPESRIPGAYNYDNMQTRCSFVRQRRTVEIDGLVGGDRCYLTHTCTYMRVCPKQRRAEASSSSSLSSSSVWSGDGTERVAVSYLCYYTYRETRTTLLLLPPPLPCPHYSADKGLRL